MSLLNNVLGRVAGFFDSDRDDSDGSTTPLAAAGGVRYRVPPPLRPASRRERMPASPAPPQDFPARAPEVRVSPARPAADPAAADNMIEWDVPAAPERATESAPNSARDPAHRPGPPPAKARRKPALDPLQQKIRARYFSARFPDAPSTLEDPSAIIKAARLYFEDGRVGTAIELLAHAAESAPREEAYWLAMLEIRFLSNNARSFVDGARRFRRRFPISESWPAVSRLGRRVAPHEPLFAADQADAPEDDGHYGAWPEVPNWIEAPWDLTSEVLAVELRGRILGTSHHRPRQSA
jgi:hypothetical protein